MSLLCVMRVVKGTKQKNYNIKQEANMAEGRRLMMATQITRVGS